MQRMKKLLAIICIITLLSLSLMPVASAAENGVQAVPAIDSQLTKKDVELLMGVDDEVSVQSTMALWFTPDYENIPFVDADFMKAELETKLMKQDLSVSASDDGAALTIKTQKGVTAVLNATQKTITFSDYDLFTSVNDSDAPDVFGDALAAGLNDELLMKLLPRTKYLSGAQTVFRLSDYEIPMLCQGGKLYLPMNTFYDLFILPKGRSNLVYNGKALFETDTDAFYDKTGKLNALGKRYFDTDKTAVPEALTRFNYHELCLMMDTAYGLKQTHGITSFDAYFERTGLKKELLSRDATRMELAMKSLITRFIADIHTLYYTPSPYFDYENKKDLLNDPSVESTNYHDRRTTFDTTPNVRTKYMGETAPIEKVGDTLFVTFDAIDMLQFGGSYYDPFVKSKLYLGNKLATDNVALFSYLQTELDEKYKDVKNVVIDISCNSGGFVPAVSYLLDAIIGKSDIEFYRANTGSLQNFAVDCDLNLDGKIDSGDKSLRERGLNISVITSDRTFSAANALACYLKYLDRDVLVLGQTSGGGSCIVEDAATPTGTFFRLSSTKTFVTRQNGKIANLEDGVRPDIALSTARMYDREYITELVDRHFKTEPKQKQLLGDVDGDTNVTVIDATMIQRHLASLTTTAYHEEVADADSDGAVTVLDTTAIQRFLAVLSHPDGIGKAIK